MQNNWIKAYANEKHRRMLFPQKPSGAGNMLRKYMDSGNSFDKKSVSVLDIGCGNGRNALALIEKGFTHVHGFDVIPSAVDDANTAVHGSHNESMFVVHDITERWPYEDKSIDIAFDVNTFSALNIEERSLYLNELDRIVAVSGIFFITTYTAADGYYAQFVHENCDGLSPGIHIHCPDDGIGRILYTGDELIEFFGEIFEPVEEEEHTWYGKMFDTYYRRHFISIIFQRKQI